MNCSGILVLEDDSVLQGLLLEVLKLGGYEAHAAANGQEALDLLRSQKIPRPCVMLVDLMMPVMNGWDFLKACDQDPDLATIPRVVLSASRERLNDAKAQAHLAKPAEIKQIFKIISSLSVVPPDA